jgi:polysaccharide biosynthesis transport protein
LEGDQMHEVDGITEHRGQLSSREVISGLRHHLPLTLAVAAITTIVVVLASAGQPRTYTSSASVIFESTGTSASTVAATMSTEKQVASSATVAEAVIDRLHVDETREEVLDGLSLSVPVDANVLVFDYTAPSIAEAERRAQAFVDAYLDYRVEEQTEASAAATASIGQRIEDLRTKLSTVTRMVAATTDPELRASRQVVANSIQSQIGIQEQQLANVIAQEGAPPRELASASKPDGPSGPNLSIHVAIGVFVGCILGLAISLIRSTFAAKLRTDHDVERVFGAPMFEQIPTGARRRDARVAVTSPARTPVSDAYRRLAIKLLAADARGHAPRSIAVVGLDGRSDTTVIVANVAAALALARRRVVAASASIGRPALETVFSVPSAPGLTDVLLGDVRMDEALQGTAIPSLRVLPGGTNGSATTVLVDTHAVDDAIGKLRGIADVVLIDAPALGVAEAGSVIAACDVVVAVGTLGGTSVEGARRMITELTLLGKRDIRVVMYARRPFITSRGSVMETRVHAADAAADAEGVIVPATARSTSGSAIAATTVASGPADAYPAAASAPSPTGRSGRSSARAR